MRVRPGSYLEHEALEALAAIAEARGHVVGNTTWSSAGRREIEVALRADPTLLAQAEELLGGRIELGRLDGEIRFLGLDHPGGPQSVEVVPPAGDGPSRAMPLGAHVAPAVRSVEVRAPSPGADFGFLNDPSLDIETKLMLYFARLCEQTDNKLDEYMRSNSDGASGGGADPTGALLQAGGAAAGGALGGPVGASIGGGIGKAMSGLLGGGAGSEGAGNQTEINARIQQLMQQRQEAAQMLSNVLNMGHETKMAFINNLRA